MSLSRWEGRPPFDRLRTPPTWGPELAQAVLELREQYPRWGKSLP